MLLYPFLVILIFLRRSVNKEDNIRFKEKIFPSSFSNSFNNEKKIIWFHAASIGEVQSIFPIINELNNKKKFNFLITTVTLSSGKFVEKEFKYFDNITHKYLPLDINFLIKKFILNWKPYVVFFIYLEIWPNLIFNFKANKITIGNTKNRAKSKAINLIVNRMGFII